MMEVIGIMDKILVQAQVLLSLIWSESIIQMNILKKWTCPVVFFIRVLITKTQIKPAERLYFQQERSRLILYLVLKQTHNITMWTL